MSYMAGNRPFGVRKVSGNDKIRIFNIQGTFCENRKKSSFLTQKSMGKIFKVDFGRPIISGQYDHMAGRYPPSGPPNPRKSQVSTLSLPSYIGYSNSGVKFQKPFFPGFCCFYSLSMIYKEQDAFFLKVWSFSFLWKKIIKKSFKTAEISLFEDMFRNVIQV